MWLRRHTVGVFQHLPASVSHVHFTFTLLHTFLTSPVQSQSEAPDHCAAPLEVRSTPHSRFRRQLTCCGVGWSWIRNLVRHVTQNRFHREVFFPFLLFLDCFLFLQRHTEQYEVQIIIIPSLRIDRHSGCRWRVCSQQTWSIVTISCEFQVSESAAWFPDHDWKLQRTLSRDS